MMHNPILQRRRSSILKNQEGAALNGMGQTRRRSSLYFDSPEVSPNCVTSQNRRRSSIYFDSQENATNLKTFGQNRSRSTVHFEGVPLIPEHVLEQLSRRHSETIEREKTNGTKEEDSDYVKPIKLKLTKPPLRRTRSLNAHHRRISTQFEEMLTDENYKKFIIITMVLGVFLLTVISISMYQMIKRNFM